MAGTQQRSAVLGDAALLLLRGHPAGNLDRLTKRNGTGVAQVGQWHNGPVHFKGIDIGQVAALDGFDRVGPVEPHTFLVDRIA